MRKNVWMWIGLVGVVWTSRLWSVPFATEVVSYEPGVGYATEYGSGLGYTDSSSVLGKPNRETFYGPVQPFNPPFERSELLSLGESGSLILRFDTPISNDPAHPYGLDFVIYGSVGFIDIDYPNGLTDDAASTFGQNEGVTRVWVSRDNLEYFLLEPSLAPTVDNLFPTDGLGQFGLPLNPALGAEDFAGKTLDEIRSLYGGSAGGTGYDLTWARDGEGMPIGLESVQYLRIDVLSGRAEIDGIAVVPEPGVMTIFGLASLGGIGIRTWRRKCRADKAGRSYDE